MQLPAPLGTKKRGKKEEKNTQAFFMRLRRVTPLLAPSLVFSPRRFA